MSLINLQAHIKIFNEGLTRGFVYGQRTISEIISRDYELSESVNNQFNHWYQDFVEYNILKPYFYDETLEEIILHSSGTLQTISKQKVLLIKDFISSHNLNTLIDSLIIKEKRCLNQKNPFCSFTTELFGRNIRTSCVLHHYNQLNEKKIFFRLFKQADFSLQKWSLPSRMHHYLLSSIMQKKNILISGATRSGKTTLLMSLVKLIPLSSHNIVIEDSQEIPLLSKIQTSLSKEKMGISLEEILSHSLRLTPDRIILGEIRSIEALPYLLSLNTGHTGSLATIHANNSVDSIVRLANLLKLHPNFTKVEHQQAIELCCKNIDLAIHLQDKTITEIIDIKGASKNAPFYEKIF